MAQFCTCGSIIINDHCTNKNCSSKHESGPIGKTARSAKRSTNEAKTAKATKTRRASKCITYNLYDVENENIE